MYHDRYSRRRATDSFHGDAENPASAGSCDQWSWMLFFGSLLVQVTSRSAWASLGVISEFMLGDQGPSWLLLATPTAFVVAWVITEPWVERLCQCLETSDNFVYLVMAGTTMAWLGALLSVKCPLQPGFLVLLIGLVGGCGCNVSTTACRELVRKHIPNKGGIIRIYEQTTASFSFFVIPIISFFILDSFGDHGGLLIHSGILMQGLVGGALLKGTRWESEECNVDKRPRSYAFIRNEGEPFMLSSHTSGRDEVRWHNSETGDPSCAKEPSTPNSQYSQRIAFGLGNLPDTPPEKRRKRMQFYRSLPSISEDNEAEDPFSSLESTPPANPITKPPRTFQHVFPPDRILIAVEAPTWTLTSTDTIKSTSTETERITTPTRFHHIAHTTTEECETGITQVDLAVTIGKKEQRPWSILCCVSWLLDDPLVLPAAFLIFVSQGALLTFMSLTPVLLNEYIDDATKMDGAYCVCVMGFSWMCLVLASPCFSSIQSSNHQAFCILALLTSSFTLYLVAHSRTLDEVVLYSSLFGLSYGSARLTTHSVLKMYLGSQKLKELGVLLSVLAATFHLLCFLLVSVWSWGDHLKNLYIVPSSTLLLCAACWTVQCCVSSVRAQRGQHDFTWSRRRRVSWQ